MNKANADFPASKSVDLARVSSVTHWSDRLFSFRLERPKNLRFKSGEFVMLGLPGGDGKPVMRAFSIASPSWDDELEFYSIKVDDGPLTSKLQHIKPGDQIILRPKAVGSLVLDALLPGKRLFLIATGTGVAPFASLIRDPEIYEKYDRIILTHTTWRHSGLAYSQRMIRQILRDPLVGDDAAKKLLYFPTTTREDSPNKGRITQMIASGTLFDALDQPPLDAAHDRIMICGSMGLNTDMRTIAVNAGLSEGSRSTPGGFVIEKAFVE